MQVSSGYFNTIEMEQEDTEGAHKTDVKPNGLCLGSDFTSKFAMSLHKYFYLNWLLQISNLLLKNSLWCFSLNKERETN